MINKKATNARTILICAFVTYISFYRKLIPRPVESTEYLVYV